MSWAYLLLHILLRIYFEPLLFLNESSLAVVTVVVVLLPWDSSAVEAAAPLEQCLDDWPMVWFTLGENRLINSVWQVYK